MIATMADLMDSWYTLLTVPAIQYNAVNVNVYKGDVPTTENNHYIVIRAEGETYRGNKRSFATDSVVVVEIVTILQNVIDRSIIDTIDNIILGRILTTTSVNGLAPKTGMEFLNVTPETTAYMEETDGIQVYHRKMIRYKQLVYQTA